MNGWIKLQIVCGGAKESFSKRKRESFEPCPICQNCLDISSRDVDRTDANEDTNEGKVERKVI